jgi:hypothetical protein
MAHHKRKRPKNQRAGCLLCKPHKANHARSKYRAKVSDQRRMGDSHPSGKPALYGSGGLGEGKPKNG